MMNLNVENANVNRTFSQAMKNNQYNPTNFEKKEIMYLNTYNYSRFGTNNKVHIYQNKVRT